MDNETEQKYSEMHLKVAFWLGVIAGTIAWLLVVIGIGAVTTMVGAF